MAIGSDGEIGTAFQSGPMTDAQRAAWFDYMRSTWGDDLMGGYATVCYPDPVKRLRPSDGASE